MQVRTGSDCALREKVASGVKGRRTMCALDEQAGKDRYRASVEGESCLECYRETCILRTKTHP
jgi:hypothetical protein